MTEMASSQFSRVIVRGFVAEGEYCIRAVLLLEDILFGARVILC